MIEIRNLSKSFNQHKVLDRLNLNIGKGETKVIIGRSGCGKSVLLRHIVGILKPDAGEVLIEGKDINKLDNKESMQLLMKMGMVFQGGALFDSLTVGKNIGFSLIEHLHLDEKTIDQRVKESLSLVELPNIQDIMPSELSGGMRKRVALARALCNKPEIILYDEPTTGVDPISADSINELIRSLHDRLKVTSIVVTHDMKSATKVADNVAMLFGGKIIYEGSVEEIEIADNPYVHQFINGLSSGPIDEGSL